MYFVSDKYGIILMDRKAYMLKYLIVPSTLNMIIVLIGKLFEKNMPQDSARTEQLFISKEPHRR